MKLRRKLLSAGLALGATALTLTTSTFAWYTSNSEVSATGMASGSAENGDSLLLISKTGENGSYFNSVTFSASATTLVPVQYTVGDGSTSYAPTFNSFANGAIGGVAATTTYYGFDLYFRSAASETVYLKSITVSNTTDSLPTKDVLTTAGMKTGWNLSSSTTYKVDLLRALKLAYWTETHEDAAENAATAQSVGGAYRLDEIVTFKTDDIGTGSNAHTYYNTVTGKSLDTDTAGVQTSFNKSTSFNFGQTPEGLETNHDLCVHFYFFIDGWDQDCFDAVQAQTFSVNLQFTSTATTKIATGYDA